MFTGLDNSLSDMAPSSEIAWVSELGLIDSERDTLLAMLDPQVEIDSITTGMSPDELWSAITCSVKVYGLAKRAQAQLKPVIGKLLLALEDYPEL